MDNDDRFGPAGTAAEPFARSTVAAGWPRRTLLRAVPAYAFCSLAGLVVPSACARSATAEGLRSSSFRSFGEAAAQWSRAGGMLIVDADHVETAPVTMTCTPGLSYHLTSDGPRTIAYAGPQFHWLFSIISKGGNPIKIDGALTFDGRNNCSIPFYARFDEVSGQDRRDFTVDGLTARNARMKRGTSRIDGSRTNTYGATGMSFHGGFDHLRLSNVRAFDISREAGAGLPGSQGCIGVGIIGTLGTTSSARHITVEDFEIARIDSDDRPGSPERFDLDGLSVFQAAETGRTPPLIQRGAIREAAGRAVKVYSPGGGGVTRQLNVHRSVHGITDGSNDIAHQHGNGTIEDIDIHYAGNAHSQPTVPIGMAADEVRDIPTPFARGIVRNIAITDTTGRAKQAIVSLYSNQADARPRAYLISGVTDTGSARFLVMPGGLGNLADAAIEIENVSTVLTAGLVGTEDPVRRLVVNARQVVNRGSRSVPFKAFYDERRAPQGHGGTLVLDRTVAGVIR